jgi:putative endonuclease
MINTGPGTHFVYIVRCRDGTLYTGFSTNVLKRVATHNAGKGAKYTRSRRPVVLVFSCDWFSKSAALRHEARIKKLTRKEKEMLICS